MSDYFVLNNRLELLVPFHYSSVGGAYTLSDNYPL